MSAIYEIDTSDEVTTVRFTQAPDLTEIRAAVAALIQINSSPLVLWDLSCGFNLNAREVQQLVEFSKSSASMSAKKIALVGDKDLHYGLMRVYEAYREDNRTDIGVFRARDEAIDWLKS